MPKRSNAGLPRRLRKKTTVIDLTTDTVDLTDEAPPPTFNVSAGALAIDLTPPPNSNATAGALYNMPRKVAKKGSRIDLYPPDGVRTVPLGYAWKYSFEKNCEKLREAALQSGGWKPAEIHFKMNGGMRNWSCHGEAGCAVAQRLKAWVEQEWPLAFTEHKNVPGY